MKKAPAPAAASRARGLRGVVTGALVMLIVPAGFLLVSLLVWPVLVGLQGLADRVLIPYASGSYRMMNGLSQLGLWDFPVNINAFTVLLMHFPLGAIIFLWYAMLFVILVNASDDGRKLPKRNKVLRAEKQKQLTLRTVKHATVSTAILFALCVPFLRSYEIYSADAMRVRGTLDWNDTVYPFSTLETFHRTVTGKGLISWDFDFSDGRSLTMVAPSIGLIEKVLSLPHIQTNIRVENHKVFGVPAKP